MRRHARPFAKWTHVCRGIQLSAGVCTSPHDELARPLFLLDTLIVTTFHFLFTTPEPLSESGMSSLVSIHASKLAMLRPMSSLNNVNRGGFAVPPPPLEVGEKLYLRCSSRAVSAISKTNSSKSLLAGRMPRRRTVASL